MSSPTLLRRLAVCGVAATFTFGAVACSDDDTTEADAPVDIDANGSDSGADAGSADAGGNGDDAVGSFDDLDDDTVVGAYIAGFERAFPEADIEGVGERTIQITFDDGSVDSEGIMSCLIATGAAGDDVDVVLVYPDGETTCD